MLTKRSLISYFRKPLFLVTVRGESMWPALVSGKKYLASSLLPIKQGSVIVFKNPLNDSEVFVKHVSAVHPDGYEVESEVSWGLNSKNLGKIPRKMVLGRLWI